MGFRPQLGAGGTAMPAPKPSPAPHWAGSWRAAGSGQQAAVLTLPRQTWWRWSLSGGVGEGEGLELPGFRAGGSRSWGGEDWEQALGLGRSALGTQPP